jgi:hypothetical protein
MTDLPASWQTDPTGRHSHRYWDGTRWTEHVADGGVAAIDPYDDPDAEAADAADAEAAEAGAAEAAETAEPADTGAAEAAETEADDAADGEAADATPAPSLTSGWATTPTEAVAATEPEPQPQPDPEREPEATSAAAAGWATASDAPDATDASAAGDADDAPTAVVPGPSSDAPTTTVPAWGSPEAVEDALFADTSVPPPGAMAPESELPGDGGGSHTKRNLLVGGVLVVIVLIVAVLAIGGDDDDGSRGSVKTRMVDSMTADDDAGLSRSQAECIADEVIDDVGADRLKDVDFDADEVPKGDLGVDIERAYSKAVGTCATGSTDDGGASPTTDGGDGADSEATTDGGVADGGSIADQLGDISHDELKEQLVAQYEAMGLPHDKADCLGEEMATAMKESGVSSEDAFASFFDFLDKCDVSLSELSGTTPSSTP